jgi:hypothetical protein
MNHASTVTMARKHTNGSAATPFQYAANGRPAMAARPASVAGW